VPEDSSAARMPRPGATIASATLLSAVISMGPSKILVQILAPVRRHYSQKSGRPQQAAATLPTYPQHLDARQRASLEPLEESAARGRHVREAAGRAGDIERGDRVPAAGDRNQLAGPGQLGGGLGDFNRAGVERFQLERAERAV